MWVKKVPERDKQLVSRAVVQLTRRGTYMSVQDKHGAILGTAKWDRRATYQEATDLLRAEKLYPESEWRQPRQGVLVAYVRNVK